MLRLASEESAQALIRNGTNTEDKKRHQWQYNVRGLCSQLYPASL